MTWLVATEFRQLTQRWSVILLFFLLPLGSLKEQKAKEDEKEEKEENKSEPEKAEYVSFLYTSLCFS